jgi:hypothetical protein
MVPLNAQPIRAQPWVMQKNGTSPIKMCCSLQVHPRQPAFGPFLNPEIDHPLLMHVLMAMFQPWMRLYCCTAVEYNGPKISELNRIRTDGACHSVLVLLPCLDLFH